MMKRDWDLLFSEYNLAAVLENQLRKVSDRVLAIDKRQFEHKSDEFIAASIASQLVVEPLELKESEISVSSRDVKIDVSHDPLRVTWDEGPTYVEGLEINFALPFSGDPELLKCRPNSFTLNPPRAVVSRNELTFPYDSPDREVAPAKAQFLRDIQALKEWIVWVNNQVTEFNSRLEARAREAILARRVELKRTADDLKGLGFRVRDEDSLATSIGSNSVKSAAKPKNSAKRKEARRTFDVALSFAGEDREYVEKVAEKLKALGITVFYDRFEQVNLWGADLAAHLGNVYSKDSRFVVLFASKHYAAKAWPTHEKQFALGRHLNGGKGCILPVRFDNTEIPGLPPTLGYLDLRVLEPEKLSELIRQKVNDDDETT